jgi:hypothetical protein
MSAAASIVLNQATSQLTRVLEGPHPETVQVDGRSLAQLLAFGARYGPLIQFYDLSDRPHGDWSEFFAADPAVGHAMHGALDLHEIETGLRRLLRACRDAASAHQRHHHLQRVQELVLRLVALLDRSRPADGQLHMHWHRLLATPRRDALAGPLQQLHAHGASQTLLPGGKEEATLDELDIVLQLLEDLVTSLIEELRHGAGASLDAAEASLRQRGHAPQAALYNAFALLFAESRHALNRFPRRLLDFYQADILQQRSVAAEPDHVFLSLGLAQGSTVADIAKGTLFSAGVDAQGQAINYAADSALSVGPATVAAMRIHRVSYGSDALPTGVLSGIVAAQDADMASFPLFGCDVLGRFGALTMMPASLGFAVASPTLMLCGGLRSVNLVLTPTQPIENAAALTQTAAAAFTLYYSSANAWIAVQDATFSVPDDGSNTLLLSFDLPADAPPLVALSTTPAAEAPASALPATAFPAFGDQPAIVAQLLPTVATPTQGDSLYQLLSLLELATVTVNVSVQQLQPLALASPSGPLDPRQTMAIWGLAPVQYGDLEIKCPELFVKTVGSLSLAIDWVGLPVCSTGFQGYYQGYRLNADGQVSETPLFDNSSFQIAFSLTSPGLWTLDSSVTSCLFQTGSGPCAPAAPVMQGSLLAATGLSPAAAPPYYDPSSSALHVVLVQPPYAFGQALYASNLSAAASANVAALRAGAQSSGTAEAAGTGAQVAQAATVNASAPDHSHAKQVSAAVNQAVTALNGQALAALHQAIQQRSTSTGQQAAHLQDLHQTMATRPRKAGSWWPNLWSKAPDPGSITAQLKAWAEAHEGELACDAMDQALTLLGASTSLGSTLATVLKSAVAVARPTLNAALQQTQSTLAQLHVQSTQASTASQQFPLPNAPWLPQASAVTISYSAQATVALQTLVDGSVSAQAQFLHLCPFSQLQAPAGCGGSVRLLPRVASQAALYIDLSAPTDAVSLLFVLKAGPRGWSSEQPELAWEQQLGYDWVAVKVVGDTTQNLLNSGIVCLQLLPLASQAPRLRVRLLRGLDDMPWVSSVSSNALSATWTGPGGAGQLGVPLPAGTITQSQADITGLGSVSQPMASLGGRPRLNGQAFDVWMAERLNHKGFAINAWDYARLALAAVPSLWQLAVVPAADADTGLPAPGKVWTVAVAGPSTPDLDDVTEPLVNPSVLAEIGNVLAQDASPFIDIQVTNPPYVRLTVQAQLIFSDADTVDFWLARLQAELVRWLSPWPDPSLGSRPPDYYTREAVAEFIRQRDYVLGITSLALIPETVRSGPVYFTSSLQHCLSGSQGEGG